MVAKTASPSQSLRATSLDTPAESLCLFPSGSSKSPRMDSHCLTWIMCPSLFQPLEFRASSWSQRGGWPPVAHEWDRHPPKQGGWGDARKPRPAPNRRLSCLNHLGPRLCFFSIWCLLSAIWDSVNSQRVVLYQELEHNHPWGYPLCSLPGTPSLKVTTIMTTSPHRYALPVIICHRNDVVWNVYFSVHTFYSIKSLLFFFFKKLLFPQYIFFLLYSMVPQLHIHVHILFSHTIMFHHKWLDIVPSAT